MSNNSSNNMIIMGAAVVGVLGAIGMFISEQFYAEKRRVRLAQDVSRLNQQLLITRRELEHLKESLKESQSHRQKQKKLRRIPPPHISSKNQSTGDATDAVLPGVSRALDNFSLTSDSEYYTEHTSGDYESDSDEFYDLSSDDETSSNPASPMRNGQRGHKSKNGVVDVLSKADLLLNGYSKEDVESAHFLLVRENSKASEAPNANILWRLGKCCYKLAKLEQDSGTLEERKRLINEGIEHCTNALRADDKNSDVHKWYAVLVGSQNDYIGNKEKVTNGQIFMKHIKEALKLDPKDGSLYHLSGRFKYEISCLNWFERKLVSTFFDESLMGTYEDAAKDFRTAEELSDIQWKENRLLLAKCYIGISDFQEAAKWLNLASEAPIVTLDDEIVEKELQTLLETYRPYLQS